MSCCWKVKITVQFIHSKIHLAFNLSPVEEYQCQMVVFVSVVKTGINYCPHDLQLTSKSYKV